MLSVESTAKMSQSEVQQLDPSLTVDITFDGLTSRWTVSARCAAAKASAICRAAVHASATDSGPPCRTIRARSTPSTNSMTRYAGTLDSSGIGCHHDSRMVQASQNLNSRSNRRRAPASPSAAG